MYSYTSIHERGVFCLNRRDSYGTGQAPVECTVGYRTVPI